MHLRLVSSLLEELSSLQSKFSSQNSANHTFLRLFSSVSPVKYSSNPVNEGKEKGKRSLDCAPIINLEEMKQRGGGDSGAARHVLGKHGAGRRFIKL